MDKKTAEMFDEVIDYIAERVARKLSEAQSVVTVESAPAADELVVIPEKQEVVEYTSKDVVEALTNLGSGDAARAVLREFGVTNVGSLKVGQYAEVIERASMDKASG